MSFIPYGRQSINQEDIDAVVETLQSDFLTTGPKVKEFEEALCSITGAKYCVAVSNGTAALHLASLVLLKKGDKVLTTPNSFLATSNAILYAKAEPIFIDIAQDGNIDLDLCEKRLKEDSTIKAIYGVHFSGNALNQKKLHYLKENYDIAILEDCSHSLGASNNNVKAGSCQNSEMATFSFHPVKNLTTGEGGAITTNCEEYYKKLTTLRNHGMIKDESMKPWEYQMIDLGFNYRITDLQCSLGISQLKKLELFLSERKKLVKKYEEKLAGSNIKTLYKFNKDSAYHLFVVLVNFDDVSISKEEFFIKMRDHGIGIQVHYIPINKQPFYKKLGYGNEKTPIMDQYYKNALSLPLYVGLQDDEQDYVIKTLKELLI